MAGQRKSGDSKPKATRKLSRTYVVVRVQGDVLTVVDPARDAKNQQDAINAVAALTPPAERNGCLGAFLASSYREQEVTTAQSWETKATDRPPSFATPATSAKQEA